MPEKSPAPVREDTPAGAPEFHLVRVGGDCEHWLYPLAGGGIAMTCGRALLGAAAGATALEAEPAGLEFPEAVELEAMVLAGRWPDRLYATFEERSDQLIRRARSFRRDPGGRWTGAGLPSGAYYADYAQTRDGRVLGLRVDARAVVYPEAYFLDFDDEDEDESPRRPARTHDGQAPAWTGTTLHWLVGEGRPLAPPRDELVMSVVATAAGDVFLSAVDSVLHAPPDSRGFRRHEELIHRSVWSGEDDQIYADWCGKGERSISRWDGADWDHVLTLDCWSFVAPSAGGVVWGHGNGGLRRWSGERRWEDIAVRAAGSGESLTGVRQLVVLGDELWITGSTPSHRSVVMTTRPWGAVTGP